MAVRLENYMVRSDAGTHEQINKLISEGKVKVNGVVRSDNNFKVDAMSDFVEVNGKVLCYRRYAYIMLNKPEGYSGKSSSRHYKTVMDLLPPWCLRRGMKPVNILDIDLSGLVLLTDDEGLHHFINLHKKSMEMVYHVQTDKSPAIKHADAFSEGMKMRDYTGLIAQMIKTDSYYKDEFAVRLTMKESGFADIKKMFNAVGVTALSAELIAFGELVMPADMEPGKWRELKSDELEIFQIKNPYI